MKNKFISPIAFIRNKSRSPSSIFKTQLFVYQILLTDERSARRNIHEIQKSRMDIVLIKKLISNSPL